MTFTAGAITDQTAVATQAWSGTRGSLGEQMDHERTQIPCIRVVRGSTIDLPRRPNEFRTRGTIDPVPVVAIWGEGTPSVFRGSQPCECFEPLGSDQALHDVLATIHSFVQSAGSESRSAAINAAVCWWRSLGDSLLDNCDDYALWLRYAKIFEPDSLDDLTVPARFIEPPREIAEEEYSNSRFEDVDQARKFLESATL